MRRPALLNGRRAVAPFPRAAAALLVLVACRGASSDHLAPEPARPPHLVLVVIDTLRADALGFLGAPHGSPHLDRLAAESVVFTQAIAPSTWTVPSMASLMTSLHPSEHGLFGSDHERLPQVLGDAHATLAEELQNGGYTTVGVVNQVFLTPRLGFAQGFDRYQSLRAWTDGLRINHRLERELAALAGDATAASPPLLLYLHYFDPHWPYRQRTPEDSAALPAALAAADDALDPPRNGGEVAEWIAGETDPDLRRRAIETLRARYALEVRWVDRAIGGLVEVLERRGVWDDAILVVTSDHGEGFWEHERLLHGHSPHEEQIRVPLLVRTPPALDIPPGRRVAPVSLLDLMPTLLDLAGLPVPEHCRGRSLVSALRGHEDAGRALLVETGGERALRTSSAKLLVRGVGAGRRRDTAGDTDVGRAAAMSLEYYDLANDPGERSNLATPCAGPCRESLRRLREIERSLVPAMEAARADVTAKEIEELESLGYVTD